MRKKTKEIFFLSQFFRSGERKWKKTKERERKWKKKKENEKPAKENERKRKNAKENERSLSRETCERSFSFVLGTRERTGLYNIKVREILNFHAHFRIKFYPRVQILYKFIVA